MNIIAKVATAVVLSAAVVAPAAAMVNYQEVASEVRSAYTSGNVSIVVNGSEATLFGWVADGGDKRAIESAALGVEGVESVRNRVFESN